MHPTFLILSLGELRLVGPNGGIYLNFGATFLDFDAIAPPFLILGPGALRPVSPRGRLVKFSI